MPTYKFTCSVCNSEVSHDVLSPVGLSGGEKHFLTCCGIVREKQETEEYIAETLQNNSVGNVLIKTSDYTQRLQKMAVERAKKYKKQEAEHRADYKRRKFGL